MVNTTSTHNILRPWLHLHNPGDPYDPRTVEVDEPEFEPMDCREDFCRAPDMPDCEGKSPLLHMTLAILTLQSQMIVWKLISTLIHR